MLDTASYTPRLKTQYRDTIRAAMKEEFGYKNEMMIPKLEKIVLNIAVVPKPSRTARKPNPLSKI